MQQMFDLCLFVISSDIITKYKLNECIQLQHCGDTWRTVMKKNLTAVRD